MALAIDAKHINIKDNIGVASYGTLHKADWDAQDVCVYSIECNFWNELTEDSLIRELSYVHFELF